MLEPLPAIETRVVVPDRFARNLPVDVGTQRSLKPRIRRQVEQELLHVF